MPVAERRALARRQVAAFARVGIELEPVEIEGRVIGRSPWGRAWCEHLEGMLVDAGRLGRGRSYARNGAVCDLQDEGCRIDAMVSGSELYHVIIEFAPAEPEVIEGLLEGCRRGLGSTLELLRGRVSNAMMELATRPESGLLPEPRGMRVGCTCLDWSVQCKHVMAALYGIGHRLDEDPELLFRLRGVDPAELMEAAAAATVAGLGHAGEPDATRDGGVGVEHAGDAGDDHARGAREAGGGEGEAIDDARLAEIFGIELEVAGGEGGGEDGREREPEPDEQDAAGGGGGGDGDREPPVTGGIRPGSGRSGADAGGRRATGGGAGSGGAKPTRTKRTTTTTKKRKETKKKTPSPRTTTRRTSIEPAASRRSAAGSRGRSAADSDLGPDAAPPSAPRSETADPRDEHLERQRGFAPTGSFVRRMRRSMELTVAELAELLQVAPATVTRWERTRGRLNLRRRTLAALDELDRETSPQR